MTIDNILEQALNVKLEMDELLRLDDKLYVCRGCGQISDYWKPGDVCYGCEAEGERQQEEDHER